MKGVTSKQGRSDYWECLRHSRHPHQCTMRYAMEIDILEAHKSKNSLHAHFTLKSIHSFLYDAKLTKFWLNIKISKKIAHIWGVIVEKLKAGLTRLKFWPLKIKIICNKKVQNSVFVSAALHGENGFQVWKWDFFFFQFLLKEFKQNSMN